MAQNGTWKEMDDFHEMVSKNLHPAEAGNLQPLKNNSEALLDKAKKWQLAAVPAEYNYAGIKNDLDTLVMKCTKINDAVKSKKSNKELKTLAMQLHTSFHKILDATEKKEH